MPPSSHAVRRTTVIDTLILPPPTDVAPLRKAFSAMVSKQWQVHVPAVFTDSLAGVGNAPSAKAQFIAEMYARACYSMLLVSATGPKALRLPIRAAALLLRSRERAIQLGSTLLVSLDWLLPQATHRQLLLMSALMGMLDVVLDETAGSGELAVLRIASLMTRQASRALLPGEQAIATLAEAVRRQESIWQSEYWGAVLEPAVRRYCLAEALAVTHAPDPTGLGHRWAGIDAAIKGMWYVLGPCMGWQSSLHRFERPAWNREQQWMANTSLLMQMIDDWVDQDEDRETRVTPVVTGAWNPQSVHNLYGKTVQDLAIMLTENGIQNRILQELFIDLYTDYLHTALEAMRTGLAA